MTSQTGSRSSRPKDKPVSLVNFRERRRHKREAGRRTLARRIGLLSFTVFLVAQFFSLSRIYFVTNFGESWAGFATTASVGSIVLLIPAVLSYGEYAGHPLGRLSQGGRFWITVMGIALLSLYLYGAFLLRNDFNAATRELGVFAILLGCVVLGSIPGFWRDIYPVVLVLFIVGIAINILGLSNLNELLLRQGIESRSGTETVSYETQSVLDLWPFLILTVRLRKPLATIIIVAGGVLMLLQQVLFQKRIGSAEILFYFFLLLIVIPQVIARWSQRRTRRQSGSVNRTAIYMAIVVLSVVITYIAAPVLLGSQVSALLARYAREDISRLLEATAMLKSLQGSAIVFGRGFGGYFSFATPDIGYWGTYLPDAGIIGKRELHVGALMPMLKGGLLLTSIYYAVVVAIIANWRKHTSDLLTLAAFAIMLTTTLVSLQGGLFILSSSFEIVILGLCLGRCLASDEAKLEIVWPNDIRKSSAESMHSLTSLETK